MATLVKQHGRYALQFYNPARTLQRKRVTLKTDDKRAAQRKQHERGYDYVGGDFDPWTDDPFDYQHTHKRVAPMTLTDAVSRFLASPGKPAAAQRRSARTGTSLPFSPAASPKRTSSRRRVHRHAQLRPRRLRRPFDARYPLPMASDCP